MTTREFHSERVSEANPVLLKASGITSLQTTNTDVQPNEVYQVTLSPDGYVAVSEAAASWLQTAHGFQRAE